MKEKQGKIGFDRALKLRWLNATAEWTAHGFSPNEIRVRLDQLLEGEVAGEDSRSAKGKTKTVLLHIWTLVPDHLKPLRNEGLGLIGELPPNNQLAVHWGMCLATYPFFRVVVEATGRLIKLQREFTKAQIQRRVEEVYGTRETVTRATRRVLQSLVEWDALVEDKERGLYQANSLLNIANAKLAIWMTEAILASSDFSSATLTAVTQSPALFPFILTSLNPRDIEANERLELLRYGLDQEFVKLRERGRESELSVG
ncbi:MAG: hypothetical protein K1X48_05010 [Burkholderiaceae bacterium]|nr:hypothetical protein [Burkholderiaceae bacterium]